MKQGPPTIDTIKMTLFDKVRLSLGDHERWIYMAEDTFDTMNRVSIIDCRKALTAERGETSKYWPRISQRPTAAYQDELKHLAVPRENFTRASCAVVPGQQFDPRMINWEAERQHQSGLILERTWTSLDS